MQNETGASAPVFSSQQTGGYIDLASFSAVSSHTNRPNQGKSVNQSSSTFQGHALAYSIDLGICLF